MLYALKVKCLYKLYILVRTKLRSFVIKMVINSYFFSCIFGGVSESGWYSRLNSAYLCYV